MDEEDSWGLVEREVLYDTSCPFLDHSDSVLYLWYMSIGDGYFFCVYSWQVFCDHSLQGYKLSFCLQSYNPKSSLSIVDLNLAEGGEDCFGFTICKKVYHGKEFSAKGKEEWYCV